jgi:hypothetical protein
LRRLANTLLFRAALMRGSGGGFRTMLSITSEISRSQSATKLRR